MIEKIDAPISVYSLYDHKKQTVWPKVILWNQKIYKLNKNGYHHTVKNGTILYHVFSSAMDDLCFKLVLNTKDLSWRLEELSDDLPN